MNGDWNFEGMIASAPSSDTDDLESWMAWYRILHKDLLQAQRELDDPRPSVSSSTSSSLGLLTARELIPSFDIDVCRQELQRDEIASENLGSQHPSTSCTLSLLAARGDISIEDYFSADVAYEGLHMA